MEQKEQNIITAQSIIGIISLILSSHYFLSYRWLYGFLKIWGIESLAVITMEDLTFPFASLNLSVLVLAALGFLGIFLWNFVSYENSNPSKNLNDNVNFIKGLPITNKVIYGIGLIIFILTFYFYILKPFLDSLGSWLGFLYIFVLIVIPLLYVFCDEKRNMILAFQIFMMFTWANYAVIVTLQELRRSKF